MASWPRAGFQKIRKPFSICPVNYDYTMTVAIIVIGLIMISNSQMRYIQQAEQSLLKYSLEMGRFDSPPFFTLTLKKLSCVEVKRNSVNPVSANYRPQSKCGSLPVFVNKLLLEHRHTHQFTYFLWLLSCYNCRVEQFRQRSYELQSLKYTIQVFTEKVCWLVVQMTLSLSSSPFLQMKIEKSQLKWPAKFYLRIDFVREVIAGDQKRTQIHGRILEAEVKYIVYQLFTKNCASLFTHYISFQWLL